MQEGVMKLSVGGRTFLCFALGLLAAAGTSTAQTFTVLTTLTGNNAYSQANLIQGVNGDFYGTSYGNAANSEYGSVFEMGTSGIASTLYTFCSKKNCTDGSYPAAGLLLAKNLYFYGTTTSGGKYGQGTVYKLTSAGKLTTLYSFCKETNCSDGEDPIGGLVQGTDGVLYGTTAYGGINGEGTIFSITTSGTFTSLYSFCSGDCTDGKQPEASLVQGSNGNFYGTTSWGTLFEITPQGVLTVLYEFCSLPSCEDGNDPLGNLAQSPAGVLYGAASKGGLNSGGVEWEYETSSSSYQEIFEFGSNWGATPNSATLGSDGNVYGTSLGAVGTSGRYFPATAYEISAENYAFTLLYTFCQSGSCTASGPPGAGMVEGTNGIFYGTLEGGDVYSLSTGLSPFVSPVPAAADVKTTVTILGTDLTGATEVTFNGTKATFTVNSATEITATVPKGATSGNIEVTTPSGTLSSNVPFTVL
jgi:uncharacterized repeat protein (TIGR03803 family)